MSSPATLFDKLWNRHVVVADKVAGALLYIDRHFLHEGSGNAFGVLERTIISIVRAPVSNG